MGKHSIRKISTFSIAATSVAATAALVAVPATASAATVHLPGDTVVNTTPSTITVDNPYLGSAGGSFVQNALGSILGLGATNTWLGQYGTQVVVSPAGTVTVNGVALATPLGQLISTGTVGLSGASWTVSAANVPFLGAGVVSLNASPSGVGGSLAFTPPFIGPVALTGSAGLNGVGANAVFSVPFLGSQQAGFAVTPTGVSVTLPGVGTVSSQQLVALVQLGVPVAVNAVQALLANGVTLPLPGGGAHLGLGGVTYNTGAFGFGSNGSLSPNGGSLGASSPWGSGSGAIDVGLGGVTTSLDGDVDTPLVNGSTSNQAGFGLSGVEVETDTNVEVTTPVGGGTVNVDANAGGSVDGDGVTLGGGANSTTGASVGDFGANAGGGVSDSSSAGIDGVSGNGSGSLDVEVTTPVGGVDVDASTGADGSAGSDGVSGGASADGGVSLG